MIQNKKILIIAYNFPPLISPQSLRWFYLAGELTKIGYGVDVLTIKMPQRFRDLLDSLTGGIKVRRTFPGFFYHLTFRFSKESRDAEKGRTEQLTIKDSLWKLLTFAHSRIYKMLNSILVPDIYSEWLPFAIGAGLKLIKINRYNVIITSSEPRVCHIVGYYLKKKAVSPG